MQSPTPTHRTARSTAAPRRALAANARRLRRSVCLSALALIGAFPASAAAHPTPALRATASPRQVLATIDTPHVNPAANRTLGDATLMACNTAPSATACTGQVLAAIDAARASEGVAPMRLPADFQTLSAAQQFLVLADLERVARGLTPAIGLSQSLNRRALLGARADTDPNLEPLYGNWAGANWAGGFRSPLEADFAWMYDDGPGSSNRDCVAAGQAGCWGHRDNILAAYESPLAMGAAADGVSMAEMFVGHDLQTGRHQPDALTGPCWPAVISQR